MFAKKTFPSMIMPLAKQRRSNQLILLFGLAVCTPLFGGTNALETALLKARNAAPSKELLGSVFVARTNAPSPVVLEQSLKACAAGLIYLNNADGYRSKVRPLIADADSFEESIKVPCGACKGEKSVTIPCSGCKGSGRCAAFRCKGGSITSPGFDGSKTVSNCSRCKGSGVCSMCKGEGRVPFLCQSCKGGGKMFSPEAALAVCWASIDKALSGMTPKNDNNEHQRKSHIAQEKIANADIRKMIEAAEKGDATAQYNLGMIYGIGGADVERNDAEAVCWIRKSADQGYAQAQEALGFCYNKGMGVEQSDGEAVKWYRKAAEQGIASAQSTIGKYYIVGKGVDKSFKEGAKWFRKAAEQGDDDSQQWLGMSYESGRGVEQSDSEAVKWYRKAAEQDNSDAQCHLATCYLKGKGVEQSYIECFKWARKAAELGNAEAQFCLGLFYKKGVGVEPSNREASKWFRKAAEQGNTEAVAALNLVGADQEDNQSELEAGKEGTLVNLQILFGTTDANELLVKLDELTNDHGSSRNWIKLEQQTGVLVEAARRGNLSGDQLMVMFKKFKVTTRKSFGITDDQVARGVTAGAYEGLRAFADLLNCVNARARGE